MPQEKKLIPAYARIKIPNTSPAHKQTQHEVPNIKIRDKIKYLHTKNTPIKPANLPPTSILGQHLE
jgi:hypothetical protein